ncbi:MAG: Rpn family recombination-promoting nuclease/putative transposase [Oscillospiraceae bacterium]|nr:Rpn family recombination-promoting nuclease/putative transposase [Oscillospiraceae bacterium]
MSKRIVREILPVKSDIVFRLFFADERDTGELVRFLKSFLHLSDDDYDELEIADPHLLREFDGDKLAIIDVKLRTKSKKTIHIEIQLRISPELKERIIFYSSKLITEQIGSGDEYDTIKKVISIVILENTLIPDSAKYHHRFVMYDQEAGVEFSDLLEIHTLELDKLPTNADGTELYDWAKFINAETEEELNMLAERNPQFQPTVVKLRELSADEKAREAYERREKARRDHNMYVRAARSEGRTEGMLEIAKNLFNGGDSVEKVMRMTGLSRERAEELRLQQ